MPFMMYKVSGAPGGEQYSFLRQVKLAGRSGPLAKLSRSVNGESKVPFGWHATAEDIVRQLGDEPTNHALVIDLKPRVSGNVSLYRLLDIWGFSYHGWTPIALRLRVLFGDRQEPNPLAFKISFVDPGTDHSLVGEFLYVQGGVSKGAWNWGMVGRVNSALLWRNAFDFLVGRLQQSMSSRV